MAWNGIIFTKLTHDKPTRPHSNGDFPVHPRVCTPRLRGTLMISICLMLTVLSVLSAHAAGGDSKHQQALNNRNSEESRDPASMSCFVAAGHATAAT